MNDATTEHSAIPQAQSGSQNSMSGAPLKKRPQAENQNDFQTELLIFEGEVRGISDERELFTHFCNSSRRVLPYRQCFYGKVNKQATSFTLLSSSSVSLVDRNAPFCRWIEKVVTRLLREEKDPSRQQSFTLPAYCDEQDEESNSYPFGELLWTPQVQDGQLVAGSIMAREVAWGNNECALTARVSELYLHAQASIKGRKAITKTKPAVRPVLMTACAVLFLLGFLPVSITALAPVEILPKKPFVLTAPFNGVVKSISVTQGEVLEAGDTVIEFDDVHLLNEKKLADQRAGIAQARYERASQGAIADHRVKREIEVAKAEYELAQAESQYATELLAQAKVIAPVPGIAIFSDRRDWEGKPVSAGQAIVSVADPNSVQLAIDLPVKESIVLSKGAEIKIFLDSDPLNPLDAVLTEASYRAQPDKRDIMSYTLRADFSDTTETQPRIGVQGTAQVFSEKASLAYVIFRRPMAAFRQYTGW